MPLFVIERNFADQLELTAEDVEGVTRINDDVGVRWLYSFLAWNWQNTPRQRAVLERAVNIMMILVIPIAVSVHTVISYIFAMTLQPGWHSTIFGPYFVVGAIFSGIAALMVVMIAGRPGVPAQ